LFNVEFIMAIREKGERMGRPYLGGHRNRGAGMLEETIASFDHNLPLFTARLPNTGSSILGSQQGRQHNPTVS
jgi:hypothetical protein